MKWSFSLTVSESKRLIGKGVARLSEVRQAKEKGIVVIATGSTNAYVVEEILDIKIEKLRYTSGLTLPAKLNKEILQFDPIPDVVIRKGEIVKDLDRFNAVQEMKEGDVYIKGCNALNYTRGLAGILIGHPEGGTIGKVLGSIYGKKITLIIPVGLEKNIAGDILEVSRTLQTPCETKEPFPSLLPVTGKIFTEIEALQTLTGVRACQIASGGVAGAEGAVRLLIEGERGQIEETAKLIESIYGEEAFIST
jgi:hypothetical protein